jgi:hypothetical protein
MASTRPFALGSRRTVLLKDYAPGRFFPDLCLDVQSASPTWRLRQASLELFVMDQTAALAAALSHLRAVRDSYWRRPQDQKSFHAFPSVHASHSSVIWPSRMWQMKA